jgi:glycosyltransferase involved in cell wall biosynthesis
MVRVCVVAFAHYSTDSRVRREAEALVDRGDQVDVIGLRKNGEEKFCKLNGVCVYQISIGRYRGSSTFLYLLSYLLFFISASFRLISLHLKNSYHVIQVHAMPDFMVFVALIPKILGVKVILDIHDLMPELYCSKFKLKDTDWLIRFITWMERSSIHFAHAAIAVHQPHLDALVRHGNPGNKFIILMNLPDPKIFSRESIKRNENPQKFEMIYHGLLAERTGLEIAIKAVAKLQKEIPDLQLRIIGEGDALPNLLKMVESESLQAWVKIHPWIPLDQLMPIIAEADVGIVPILYDNFTKYMLPVKLLEYAGLGIPVICSRTETIQAYFDDSMVAYFTPGDVYELVDCIRDLYYYPEKRENLRANADRFNQENNWVQQKQVFFNLIDHLISGKSF